MKSSSWDIFCTVVDNYGDIGVCWRLARQLVSEYGINVRLWVDDLRSFSVLRPDVREVCESQMIEGVEVRRWTTPFKAVKPADVVIETFACRLPDSYVEAMAVCEPKPVWINLEHVSAEPWIVGSHMLPSPHPRLPLVTYFFFPGVVPRTGGLMASRDIDSRRAAFRASIGQQEALWDRFGIARPPVEARLISMFGYRNAALPSLLRAWAEDEKQTVVLVPNGPILEDVSDFFRETEISIGQTLQSGALTLHVVQFVDQSYYDELLWICDFNFVRGEDSFARAQWAERPFAWQIYPQASGAHWEKLEAFLKLYTAGLSADAAAAMRTFWYLWNGDPALSPHEIPEAWQKMWRQHKSLNNNAENWSADLGSLGNLAGNLVQFVEKKL